MKVSEVASKLSITPDTVRYYTRVKLLSPHIDPSNGYKRYTQDDLTRLKFILAARSLGFSVADITQLLLEADNHKSPCPTARRIIEKRLQETQQRFDEMLQLRNRMQHALQHWQDKPDKEPVGGITCHLIESFVAGMDKESAS